MPYLVPQSLQRIAVYVRDGDAVGDGIIKVPFLATLRHTFPNAHITWISGKGRSTYGSSLAHLVDGLIDNLIDDSKIGNRWLEMLSQPLPDQAPFDLIVDTQKSLRTSLLVRRIKHHHYVASTLDWRLSDFKPDPAQPNIRLIDQLLCLINAVTGQPTSIVAQIKLDRAYEKLATTLLPAGPRYIGLVPGAGKAFKQWPLGNYIQLAKQQVTHGLTPVFFLGPNEADWQTTITKALPQACFPESQIPQEQQALAGPPLVIALAKRLTLAVSNDCGTAHMLAVAQTTPIISLFAQTNPSKFPPACQHNIILTAQQFGGTTMADIPLQGVNDAIAKLH